jgi:hypothetical protein
MANHEPSYPIVLVVILGAVIPLLALCYVGYWISLCVNNPPDASFDTNLNLLWTFIKAIFFVALGYISFGSAYGFHTGWKDKIENQRLERTFQEPSSPMPIYRESQEAREEREASEAFYREADMYTARADQRLRELEEVERATELDKLQKELEKLKAVRSALPAEDSSSDPETL